MSAFPDRQPSDASSVVCAFAAYLMWGLFPIYFKAVGRASSGEVLCHRIVWSVGLLIVVAALALGPRRTLALCGPARRLPLYLVSSLLISGNWLLYIWGVNHGHIVDASLGYYINPLLNVLLGVVFLRERLSWPQRISVALALLGVVSLVVQLGRLPWISLVLPLQFGLYALVRKKAQFDPLIGLLMETALVTPPALAYLGWLHARGELAFGSSGLAFDALLAFAGVATAVPLLLFGIGARRLRLATLGLIQYISPTCQLLAGVLLYGETFTSAHEVAFALIWAALALYSADALLAARRAASARAP